MAAMQGIDEQQEDLLRHVVEQPEDLFGGELAGIDEALDSASREALLAEVEQKVKAQDASPWSITPQEAAVLLENRPDWVPRRPAQNKLLQGVHNTFFVADRAPGAEVGSGLDLEYFKKLIQKLVKESGGKPLNEKALVEIFNHADEDKSGYVDFYEFLELYGQVKAGKVESLGGSGLFRSMMKKKER